MTDHSTFDAAMARPVTHAHVERFVAAQSRQAAALEMLAEAVMLIAKTNAAALGGES